MTWKSVIQLMSCAENGDHIVSTALYNWRQNWLRHFAVFRQGKITALPPLPPPRNVHTMLCNCMFDVPMYETPDPFLFFLE